MYKVHSTAPRILARVARMPNMITLDITQDALQLGLLEPALVATCLHGKEISIPPTFK